MQQSRNSSAATKDKNRAHTQRLRRVRLSHHQSGQNVINECHCVQLPSSHHCFKADKRFCSTSCLCLSRFLAARLDFFPLFTKPRFIRTTLSFCSTHTFLTRPTFFTNPFS
mmetsp:Transcript_55648/g.108963  ORF Transcript_55648/g.108963 Transcript_55648/m.108963 type:complete len:111 (-) Transcript_55648:1037-1369(-)